MRKSVLLTRSEADNRVLKQKLVSCNLNLYECCLLERGLVKFDNTILSDGIDLVITSYFTASNIPYYSMVGKIWIVGKNTKKILEDKGYIVAFCAQDALTLKKELMKYKNLRAIYLSGDNITEEMPDYISRVIFYNVFYKKSLIQSEICRIKQGLDYILLYSENCAKTLLKLLFNHGLIKYLENTVIIAISYKVAKVIQGYFKYIQVCQGSDKILKFLKEIS